MPMGRVGSLAAAVLAVATAVGAAPAAPVAPAAAGAVAERVARPPRTFTVAAVGDWLSEGVVNTAAAAVAPPGVRYDHEPLLRAVAPLVAAADLAVCHMETPIGAPGTKAGFIATSAYGTSLIAAPYEVAADLRRVGFDRCSTASNHANDLGAEGIDTTLAALDAAGLTHTGTARSPAEADVDVFVVNGVRVAHMSYARNSNTGWPNEPWRLDTAVTPDAVLADVAAARAAGAEVVIVSLHVFVEMQTGPATADRALVQAITAGGDVDLVVVHGPHVVQPVEQVNGTWVYWSLGNFLSGMGVPGRARYSDPRTLDGLMATTRFTERPDGSWLVEPWPVLVCTLPASRTVHPGVAAAADPALPASVRAQLDACVQRTLAVEPAIH